MMEWLKGAFSPLKSHLLAMVGVLAVAGVFTSAIAAVYISKQNDTIETMSATNKQWSANWKTMMAVRELDKSAVASLQSQLGVIVADNDDLAEAVQRLEANDEIVKKYMAQPIPPELRRLLNGQ